MVKTNLYLLMKYHVKIKIKLKEKKDQIYASEKKESGFNIVNGKDVK